MSELSDQLYEKILALIEQGNLLMDKGEYPRAVEVYRAALMELPQPHTQWEAFVWLKASIGDAFFLMEEYDVAAEEFFDAMNGVDGSYNCFVLLRLGQCLYQRADPAALDYLCKAYFLEGDDIFSHENKKYLEAVKSVLGKGGG
ncbi:hypothetical protein TZ03_25210 [Pseudomonas sp. 10-1B]|uniref:tetratricopeptide repeat protein n=1 Tax=Pseudomonas sp. 10-1B TaxID=1546029 RepID=UPI00061E64E9|nr:hypothetical protein [Pseudomonas sp. 10-1B]KIY37963.1 hypothetical protein TZ03_25210 [Pseudomonas sp. 10-1B]